MPILLMFSIASAELRFKCTSDGDTPIYLVYYFSIPFWGLGDETKTIILSGNNGMDGATPYIWNGTGTKDGSFYKSPHDKSSLTFNGGWIGIEPVLKYTNRSGETTVYKCQDITPE